MTNLDLALITTGITGAAVFCLLFSKRFSWNWTRYYGMDQEQVRQSAPFWLGLVSLLSLGAIVFSIHALLVTHGAAR